MYRDCGAAIDRGFLAETSGQEVCSLNGVMESVLTDENHKISARLSINHFS
jgi:hypothetical protein